MAQTNAIAAPRVCGIANGSSTATATARMENFQARPESCSRITNAVHRVRNASSISQRQIARRHCTLIERSEEHTSELQSRQYLVCRLLLEKKKNRLHTIRLLSPFSSTVGRLRPPLSVPRP